MGFGVFKGLGLRVYPRAYVVLFWFGYGFLVRDYNILAKKELHRSLGLLGLRISQNLGYHIVGVPILRIIKCWGLYRGP